MRLDFHLKLPESFKKVDDPINTIQPGHFLNSIEDLKGQASFTDGNLYDSTLSLNLELVRATKYHNSLKWPFKSL